MSSYSKMIHKKLLILLILIGAFVFFSFPGWTQAVFPNPEYLALIQQKIGTYLFYPWEAKFKGWEGVVIVKFTLLRDGHLKELDIVKSSGYPLLDEAAVSAVRKASPYPSPEYYHQAEELEVILPINYQGLKIAQKPPPAPPEHFQPISLSPEEEIIPSPQPEEPPPRPLPEEEVQLPSQKKVPPLQEETPPPLPEEARPGQKEISLPADELEEFIKLAVKNNRPTQIARQEIELAQLKVGEAQRGLFPALKLEGYDTKGEVYKVEYEEREAKIQLDQPVYYGGRLRDTLNQSKVNLEITKRNYDRLRIDVSHKAEVAYYNLVASRMNLKIQEEIRQEAKKMLDVVEKQFEDGLVTPLEISSAQSWYDQIVFQIDSTKQDMAMAELTFAQILNVPEAPEIKRQELRIKKLDLDLTQCLDAGLKNRPEIYLSELLVKFNQYGKRIEESKNKFTIDLTTSYSHYQGAWKTESMRDSNNWYVGIKATKPWGGSTIVTSATTEETQPRYGQTSPTKTSTISAEFNLLNNLQRLSEKKKSELELQRSLSDLNETTKTINFEIKDAYLNYQKALLQATTAQSETEFRRREVEVLKVRAQVGEIEFSNVMEALINLSRAQTTYIQSLANYFISLANLRKAAGYGIRI